MANMTGESHCCSSDDATLTAQVDSTTGYITNIDEIRSAEYPALNSTTYLDHAGTTSYAKSLIEAYTNDLKNNLFGNPHSASAPSQLSSRRIDDVRLEVLRFFKADPDHFDVVFVANATAAMKLVADSLRDREDGSWYGYHQESHTSLVGVRELASKGSRCFSSDVEIENWLEDQALPTTCAEDSLCLLGYPGQSNMTGKQWLLDWCKRVNYMRQGQEKHVYTLFDAAALASTSPLNLSDEATAPDFTTVSFYKIFGFPDLGALVIRKASGDILRHRRYYGGGTVDAVSVKDEIWHAKREVSLHVALEDGTLPFHNIIALQHAIRVHTKLYHSMEVIQRHTQHLAAMVKTRLRGLRHANGLPVCKLYGPSDLGSTMRNTSGPVVNFNLLDRLGGYLSTTEVEKLAVVNNIQFRTGGLCNPGGTSSYLGLSPQDLRQNYAAGHRCGGENDVINNRPTGTIRVSVGAMSSIHDVTKFLDFINEYFVDRSQPLSVELSMPVQHSATISSFLVESLCIFPVKSCAAFRIPPATPWEVGPRGLAWDREWCLVHEGTNTALSQKRYPTMALLQPSVDLSRSLLTISHNVGGTGTRKLQVSLEDDALIGSRPSNVCGEMVQVERYTDFKVSRFFTDALGVPCTLARFPRSGYERLSQIRQRTGQAQRSELSDQRSIALSNESPILLVSRSSVNRLNENIKRTGGVGKTVSADSFRGNIVVAEELRPGQLETPYAEEQWKHICIGDGLEGAFEVLGPCQRCQMVCVNQKDASRRPEPFSTLAKTRKRDGKVWFGMHMCLKQIANESARVAHISVGDRVQIS